MGEFGLLASRLNDNTNLLRKFDEALRYFKKTKVEENSSETQHQAQKLLAVLKPVTVILDGQLSKSVDLDDRDIVELLQQRRLKDWQRYRNQIIRLTDKIESGNFEMTKGDYKMLDDVADAIDMQCANLFKRISGRI
jgi:hypothetical protein